MTRALIGVALALLSTGCASVNRQELCPMWFLAVAANLAMSPWTGSGLVEYQCPPQRDLPSRVEWGYTWDTRLIGPFPTRDECSSNRTITWHETQADLGPCNVYPQAGTR
jgi:hypothetical protein